MNNHSFFSPQRTFLFASNTSFKACFRRNSKALELQNSRKRVNCCKKERSRRKNFDFNLFLIIKLHRSYKPPPKHTSPERERCWKTRRCLFCSFIPIATLTYRKLASSLMSSALKLLFNLMCHHPFRFAMVWITTSKRTSKLKSALFSKYKDVYTSEYFKFQVRVLICTQAFVLLKEALSCNPARKTSAPPFLANPILFCI